MKKYDFSIIANARSGRSIMVFDFVDSARVMCTANELPAIFDDFVTKVTAMDARAWVHVVCNDARTPRGFKQSREAQGLYV
jgi:hypothetical protein